MSSDTRGIDLPQAAPAGPDVVGRSATPDVRSRIEAMMSDRPAWRVTNDSSDRPGLLAHTAAVMAEHGLSIRSARATTLDHRAQQEFEVVLVDGAPEPNWGVVGLDVRAGLLGERERSFSPFRPVGEAEVRIERDGPDQWLVHVSAPDTVGLLAIAAGWFADHELNVIRAEIGGEFGWAVDTFVVTGRIPPGGSLRLAAMLSGRDGVSSPGQVTPVDVVRW